MNVASFPLKLRIVQQEVTTQNALIRYAVVFQAEAMAITKACEAVSAVMAEEGVPNAVTIYSNSQTLLQALNGRWITSKTVWECASALIDHVSNHQHCTHCLSLGGSLYVG